MRHNLKVGGIGLVAIAVALAMLVAPVMAAAPTVDTETTDTSTTSDLTDGTTITNFSANSSKMSRIEASFDTDNASIQVIDPATGEVHAENTSADMKETNATNNYYAWNMTHDELATMPMDAGQNKSVTVKFINDSTIDNPDTTEITVHLENVDDRAVVYAGNEAAAGNVNGLSTNTEVDEPLLGMFGSNDSTTTIEADSVGLGTNATGTTVHVIAANTSGEDPFAEASEGGIFSSYESESFIDTHQLHVSGHEHAVFYEGAPASELADGYTYAETTTVNGHDAYAIHVDDDYSGESTLDVKTVANDDYRFDKKLSVKSDAYGGFFNGLTASVAPTAGLGVA